MSPPWIFNYLCCRDIVVSHTNACISHCFCTIHCPAETTCLHGGVPACCLCIYYFDIYHSEFYHNLLQYWHSPFISHAAYISIPFRRILFILGHVSGVILPKAFEYTYLDCAWVASLVKIICLTFLYGYIGIYIYTLTASFYVKYDDGKVSNFMIPFYAAIYINFCLDIYLLTQVKD